MKDYQKSDYALNRYSQGIVYRFNGETVTITMEAYLAENQGKTEQDFIALKALSDEIYLSQVRDENAQTKKNVPLHGHEELLEAKSVPMDEQYIELQDQRYATEAIHAALNGNLLTKVQKRRFILHFIKGLSFREIAESEGVHFSSVSESISTAVGKVVKIFPVFKD